MILGVCVRAGPKKMVDALSCEFPKLGKRIAKKRFKAIFL